jgi:UDP-glucuronate 4-epimerase
MKALVTGSAGFVGFHLARRLLAEGHEVLGYDGMSAYYDVELKRRRHAILRQEARFTAVEAMLEDKAQLDRAVADFQPDMVFHLAAQAGVRYSIEQPETYVSSNLVGTFNLLEAMRAHPPQHLLIASTSSVYGGNEQMPFGEVDRTDFPISFYAATKKACEAMSHSYAHLYAIPTTCFRFFTVFGPWGRPDMALFKFVDAIEKGEPIDIYGMGQMRRDFTYIDDLIEGIVRLMDVVPIAGQPVQAEGVRDSLSPVAPWRVVNIAGGEPTGLLDFVTAVEAAMDMPAKRNMLPRQQGDVVETFADEKLLKALTGFVPQTELATGVRAFVDWYRGYRSGGARK